MTIRAGALFAMCLLAGVPAVVADVTASGQMLTVTTANATAVFQGPDLVGFTNLLTNESYLKSAPPSPLMNLEIQGGPSGNLQSSGWSTSVQAGTTIATLTMHDAVRTIAISVKIDAASQEIVIDVAGQATQTGVSAVYWGMAGVDLSGGRLIVPASSGIVIDQKHAQTGARMQYPLDWQAQMAVYEAAAGSMVIYSNDSQYLAKQLRIGTHVAATMDLTLATQPNGPFSADTAVPAVEWRLKAFAGDWRTAAAVYRDWLAANRPPVSNASHAWVNNIRTVVQLGTRDTSVLNTLATEVTPSKTLLYIPGWRKFGYDVNYPDYTPDTDVASFVAQAHTLGFKVMLHTDFIGVTPSNSDFASVQQWQTKDPSTLQPIGWLWDSPVNTPNRFAWINPAAAAYRSLFISRIGTAVAAVQPDALHLDVSAPMFNDGNGLIGGMNYPQGAVQLHKDIMAAFPNLALGGEGMNDVIYPYNSFAQNWWSGDNKTLLGHPIANFLWNSQATGVQVLYYGHLGQPAAKDPGFVDSLTPIESEGILPALAINTAADVDLSQPDNVRLNHWLTSWQTNAFQPDWNGSWSGVLIPYKGVSNATATLSDTGTIFNLSSGGTSIYQRVHDANQITTSRYVLNWPAFDATKIYGLDPVQQYWLDDVARPNTTHVSNLPAGVKLGPDSAVAPGFALMQLAPTPSYDFFGSLWQANSGITFNGADGPLGFGATAQLATTAAGGVARTGISMQPPYLQNHAGGEAFVEWTVPIPQATAFSFSAGVADNAGTCTDGVIFRVVVNGVEAWRANVLHQGWVDGSVNLSGYAGTTAKLRIATNPGPANNPNCDWASFSNLTFVSLGNITASVPIVLGSGATDSGFSGTGSYSSITGTVTGASVPGQFVLFTAPASTVSAGSSLATLPFKTWLGAEGELPIQGTIFGSGNVGTGISGGISKPNAIFGHPPSNGRTILSWTLALPAAGSLELGWSAGIGDGSLSSTGVQFSVRINGFTYWTMFQPSPAGWTPATLDLSSWRGQNVLVQLVTDSVGNNDYDWGWWADLKLTAVPNSCSYSVAASPAQPARGGPLAINITASPGCPWSAYSDLPWATITGAGSGSGNGTVSLNLAANLSGAPRSGNIVIAGQSIAISQNPPATGDFDGNGVPEVALQFPDGSMGVWYLNATGRQLSITGFAFLAGATSGISLVDTVDLNGDGVADAILRFSDGSIGAWYMSGPGGHTITGFAFLSGPIQGWVPVGVADLNGDGHPDLVIQRPDGTIGVWYLGGPLGNQIQGFALISGPISGWSVAGVADLNHDGHPDVILQQPNGTAGVWYMGGVQGNTIQGFAVIAGSSPWAIVGVTDMDGDGQPDLMIRNPDGTVGVWYLGGAQGNQITGFAPVSTPGNTGWRELAAH